MCKKHVLSAEEIFCLEGCRSYEQYYKMRKGFEGGNCAFCNLDYSLNRVLWEDSRAMVWRVPERYLRPELKLHALVVPKRHVRFEADLSNDEVLSTHHAKKFVRKKLGYNGGLSHVREGDMRLNAGTVPHLHYNIFEPNQLHEVRIPVFKDPSDRQKNRRRALEFSTRYEAGEILM